MGNRQNSSIASVIGARIKSRRLELTLSQEELAEKCSVHRTYVGAIERGEKNITVPVLSKFSHALGKPIGFFVEGL